MNDLDFIKKYDGPPVRIMEVCGTHTSAIFKSGIRGFLSPEIKLVSGPGCPVCVTVPEYIDQCIEAALTPGFEIICFGDLLKIPGTKMTLSDAKGIGGRVRMAWSPFDALALAAQDTETTYVVAAIGFETTAPAFALLIEEAEELGLRNLKLLTSLKSALSAIDWICLEGERIDAFICPGHVSVITGADAYIPLAEQYNKPFVIAGFESGQLIAAISAAVSDATEGFVSDAAECFVSDAVKRNASVRNLYPEAVSAEGNKRAQKAIERYFDLGSAVWRGLGAVDKSGYYLKEAFSEYDFIKSGGNSSVTREAKKSCGEPDGCRCGDVILGRIDPDECPLFGTVCSPASAVGPCMVSSEGACGCWYRGRG